MNGRARKTIALVFGGAALAAGLLFGISLMRGYGHQVPLVIGPYKKAVFVLLGLVLAAAAGFYFCPLNTQTAAGTLLTACGSLYFTGRMVLAYRAPESPLLFTMDQWMILPLGAFGAGLALWAGSLFRNRTEGIRIPDKLRLPLVLLLMFIVLQPVMNGAFLWDDAFFSVEAQVMRVTGAPVFARVWREIVEYVRIGRINPFAAFHFIVFYFLPDVRAYKLLLVLLTLANGALFYRFLRLWGKDRRPALAALLLVPLCFQLRIYHDPLNSYYGLMQVMFCELTGSLILFVRWLREGRKRFLLLSLLLFLTGLMSYEMFFPLTALFLIPALAHEKKLIPGFVRILPYALAAIGLFALSMILRTNITAETAYSGTTFSLDLPAFLRALGCHLSAAFPLSYRTSGYDAAMFGRLVPWRTIFNTSFTVFLRSIRWEDLIACAVLVLTVCGTEEKKPKPSAFRAVFALLLWILPGLVISLSSKYQQEFRPGMAYIPVYFSCFGAAMLLYELSAALTRVFSPRIVRLLLSGIGCVFLLVGMQDNRRISGMLNDVFLYPRSAGESALRAGILDGVTDPDSLVVSTVPYSLWEHGWMMEPHQDSFYTLNTGRPLNNVTGAADFAAARAGKKSSWFMFPDAHVVFYTGNARAGFAKAGRLRETGIDAENGRLSNPMATDIRFFVSGDHLNGRTLLYETKDGTVVRIPVENAWLLRETEAGRLYKLQEDEPVQFDTLCVADN